MMVGNLRAIAIGVATAVLILLPRWIWTLFPQWDWSSPVLLVLLVPVIAIISFLMPRKSPEAREAGNYTGVADLMLHIHRPPSGSAPRPWVFHGLVSFFLHLFGGTVGVAGAAIEWTQGALVASRPPSARWFDHQRRTDIACLLAGSLSAAFGAPYGAILFSVELRTGGQTLAPIVSAFVAYFAVEYLGALLSVGAMGYASFFEGYQFSTFHSFSALLVIAVTVALSVALCTGFIYFSRWGRESLVQILGDRPWLRYLVGGALMITVITAYAPAHLPQSLLLEKILSLDASRAELGILLLSQFLVSALVLATFGSAGVFWLVFLIGSVIGAIVNSFIPGFGAVVPLLGAATVWSCFFGTPFTAALIVLGMSGNLSILGPAVICTVLGNTIATRLGLRSLPDRDMLERGLHLSKGRSLSVLDALDVGEAMVTDFEMANEESTIDQLYSSLKRSKYPFLPISTASGRYLGLLTADIVERAWFDHLKGEEGRFSKLVEARDLLFLSGSRIEAIRVDEKLSAAADVFQQTPVVPVISEEKKVVGLLFAHNVRIAYDQEVANRALFFRHREASSS